MATISIAQNPTFVALVEVPRVGGDPISVPFEFRYMPRSALAALFDRWNTERDDLQRRVAEENLSLAESTRIELQMQVEQLKTVVVNWGFDEPFDDDHLLALVSAAVTIPLAVLQTYQQAYQRHRLGN